MTPAIEHLLNLVDAGKLYPSSHGGRPHLSRAAMYSWVTRGLKVNGSMLKLRAVKIGTGWFTTREWLEEFVSKTTAASVPAVAKMRTPAQRAKAEAEADRILEEAGI